MSSGGNIGDLYKPLSSRQVETIHQKALDLLEEVGITYEAGMGDTLGMLENAGCRIDKKRSLIFFPRYLVEKMVNNAPGEFTLYSRDGRNDLHLGKDRVYAGTGGTSIKILDLDTGKARQTLVQDQYNVAKLVDTLDNIHFYQSCCVCHDVPPEKYDVNILFAAMMGTTKHVMFGCNFDYGLREAFELASLVAGNREELIRRPIFSISSCAIISPLKFCTQSIANVREAAKLGIPTTITSAPMSGSTAPMTMAGTLLMIHAEELAGITVHQLTQPGAPVLYGGLPALAEMSSMGYRGGAVECGMMMAAVHQLSQRIDIPNYASSGLSDSKIPDAQAGWEKAMTTLISVMGGNNYIHHAAGMLESMLTIAYEQYIIDDEIIGASCKLLEGIPVDEEHLAYSAIKEVGPGGNFIMNPHTYSHMRTEYFQGNGISDKRSRDKWEADGSKNTWQRANEMARHVIFDGASSKLEKNLEKTLRDKFDLYLQL